MSTVRLTRCEPRLVGLRPAQLSIAAVWLAAGAAQAQDADSRQLAPGFTTRPAGSRLVILPADMELFSISAGGVTEPRADWTESAQRYFGEALQSHAGRLGALASMLEGDR